LKLLESLHNVKVSLFVHPFKSMLKIGQSLKIKDSPKCQKEKKTLRFYSFLDDHT
jgi:hypothetical protein